MAGVSAIVVAAVAFFSISLFFYIRTQSAPEELRSKIRAQSHQTAHESTDSIKSRVGTGMTKEFVEFALGVPDKIDEMTSGESQLELWEYECADGRITISMLNGKVQSVRP
jgi:hypothetical protein